MKNNNLRILRKQQGFTQKMLASKTGLSQRAISEIENRLRPLTQQEIKTLALVFHVSEEEILKRKS